MVCRHIRYRSLSQMFTYTKIDGMIRLSEPYITRGRREPPARDHAEATITLQYPIEARITAKTASTFKYASLRLAGGLSNGAF